METEGPAPAWVTEAVKKAIEEPRDFFATSFAFLRSPRRFADEWYRGVRHAMNPAGCVATGGAMALPVIDFLERWFPSNGPEASSSFASIVLAAIGPYLYYAALGLVAHGLLRMQGSPRPASATVGVALYAGALPGLGASVVGTASVAFLAARGDFPMGPAATTSPVTPSVAVLVCLFVIVGAFGLFVAAACAGLAGLHRVRLWRAIVSFVAAVLLIGLVFGQLGGKIPGRYGLHFELHVWEHGRFIRPDLRFTIS